MLEGTAEERPGAGGTWCTHSRLPGTDGFRGPLGTLGGKLALQQQKTLLKLCGCVLFFFFFFFPLGVQELRVDSPSQIKSGLVTWRDCGGSAAVPAFLHKFLLVQLPCLQSWCRPGCPLTMVS